LGTAEDRQIAYRAVDLSLTFWRTASGLEVDFILGDFQVAIEVKGAARVHDGDLASLRALRQEYTLNHAVVVRLETAPRQTQDGIQVVPWQTFLERLWAGEFCR